MVSRCHSAGKPMVEAGQRRARLAEGPCPVPGCRPSLGSSQLITRNLSLWCFTANGVAASNAPKQLPPHAARIQSVKAYARRTGRGKFSPWCRLCVGSVRFNAAKPGQAQGAAGKAVARLPCSLRSRSKRSLSKAQSLWGQLPAL